VKYFLTLALAVYSLIGNAIEIDTQKSTGINFCDISTSTNYVNFCSKNSKSVDEKIIRNQIISSALTAPDGSLPVDLKSVSFNEKNDQQAVDNLRIEQRARYLTQVERLVFQSMGLRRDQLKELFNEIKSQLIQVAEKSGIGQDILERTARTELFSFENLNSKNSARILQACDKDGMGEQAIFLDKIDQNYYMLICPGELLRAARASRFPLKLLSFFIGHELGHSVDISKAGTQIFSNYLNCLEKFYGTEFRLNISKALQTELANRSVPSSTLVGLAEKASWNRYYDAVHKSISEKNLNIGLSEVFKSTFYAYELTADIFGHLGFARQLEKLSQSEKNEILEDFTRYRVCEDEFVSLTHPNSRLRTTIGFQSNILRNLLRCQTPAKEANSCNWLEN